jgi:cytochrome c oxidase assembly factor CtaG/cytochrome c2
MSLSPAIVLLAGLVLYARGVARLRARGRGVRASELAAAAVGILVILAALLSPLDRLAATLLCAHMVQHTLLTLVAAPLLALARPLAVIATALPPRAALPRALMRCRPRAPLAWAAHGLALWAWHVPPLYDRALASPVLHALEHVTLLGTAVLLWWSVSRRRRPLAGALWLFTTALHTSVLGAVMTLAPRPWFPEHAGGLGLSALEDQQLAGLVMWVPAGTLLTGFALALLAAWFRYAERATPALGRRATPLLLAVLLAGALAGCEGAAPTATAMTGGDPQRGRAAIRKYGCQTCHTIPGVPGADATVGPPLTQLAARGFVAGRANSPRALIDWIRHPQRQRPASPMPEMGVTEEDSRDIAAYLYTLR